MLAASPWVWQKSINRGRLDRLNRQAGIDYADQRMIEALANASESSARDHARASGHSPDAPEAQAEVDIARSSIFRHAIEGALAKGAHSAAIKLHEQTKSKLIPGDAELLDEIIEDAREIEIGREYVARIAPLSLTINTSIEDLDKAEAEATAKNNTDWKDNDTQRATNQHFIDIQFGKAKRQLDEDKARLARSVHDWLTIPGPDGLPRIERPPIAIWARLTPEDRKRVDRVLEQNIDTMIDSVAQKSEIMLAPHAISPETIAKGDDNLMPAQARPSGTVRGGRLVRPWEEMRIEIFESHIRAIRELDPNIPTFPMSCRSTVFRILEL